MLLFPHNELKFSSLYFEFWHTRIKKHVTLSFLYHMQSFYLSPMNNKNFSIRDLFEFEIITSKINI